MTIDANATARTGLPVDARGDLPDAATLSERLRWAVDRAVGAALDVEIHVSPGAEDLPTHLAQVLASIRAAAAPRGVAIRVVS
jgi:hypothetical protein